MTDPARRPSHLIPRPIFDALIALEESARRDAVLMHEASTGHPSSRKDADALQAVIRTGTLRDQLAALILKHTGGEAPNPRG